MNAENRKHGLPQGQPHVRPQGPPEAPREDTKPSPGPGDRQARLDDELDDTFPASDPPSLTDPVRRTGEPAPERREGGRPDAGGLGARLWAWWRGLANPGR